MLEFYKYVTSGWSEFLIFVFSVGITLFVVQLITLSFIRGIMTEIFSYQFALMDEINKNKYEK